MSDDDYDDDDYYDDDDDLILKQFNLKFYKLYLFDKLLDDNNLLGCINSIKYINTIKMSEITKICLASNKITDLNLICDLFPNLCILDINHNRIQDLSPIIKLKDTLIELNICHNNIEDISILKHMTNIINLDLSYNHIKNINELKYMTNLKYLNLSNNEFKIETNDDTNIIIDICNNMNKLNTPIKPNKLLLTGIYYLEEYIHKIMIQNTITPITISIIYLIYQNNKDHPIIQSYSINEIWSSKDLFNQLFKNLGFKLKYNYDIGDLVDSNNNHNNYGTIRNYKNLKLRFDRSFK